MQEQQEYKYSCDKHGPHNGRSFGANETELCPKCMNDRIAATRKENHKLKAALKAATSATAPTNNNPPVAKQDGTGMPQSEPLSRHTRVPEGCVLLDFTEYPEVLEGLQHLARNQIRTLEHQSLFLLRGAVQTARASTQYKPMIPAECPKAVYGFTPINPCTEMDQATVEEA